MDTFLQADLAVPGHLFLPLSFTVSLLSFTCPNPSGVSWRGGEDFLKSHVQLTFELHPPMTLGWLSVPARVCVSRRLFLTGA